MAAKRKSKSREQQLKERAAARGYELVKEKDVYYAETAGTRFGPMRNLDEVDEFLPEAA